MAGTNATARTRVARMANRLDALPTFTESEGQRVATISDMLPSLTAGRREYGEANPSSAPCACQPRRRRRPNRRRAAPARLRPPAPPVAATAPAMPHNRRRRPPRAGAAAADPFRRRASAVQWSVYQGENE